MNYFRKQFLYGFGCGVFLSSALYPDNEQIYHQWLKYIYFINNGHKISAEFYQIIDKILIHTEENPDNIYYETKNKRRQFMRGVKAFLNLCEHYKINDEAFIQKIYVFWQIYCNIDDTISLHKNIMEYILLFVNTAKLLKENNFEIKLDTT